MFVEEFILDRTLEPALAERPLDGFRMIDPTCGSGHFLLGAFARLLDRWHRNAPGLETQARVQEALNAVHGVDVNPFAVAIARFRLTLAAMQACGLIRLEAAPAFQYHLAAGDSLWFGSDQHTFDFEPDHRTNAGLPGFAYSYEDRAVLRDILQASNYDVVVGNPPYIAVKDRALSNAYRLFYSACKGKYAMTVPFMQLFFQLAKAGTDVRPAGWVGQITSNAFMKREFGVPLIEQFLSTKDLRLVADTSGAYIPGHGTPTVIVVGRNARPIGSTVRTVLGVRGEPGRPDFPPNGIVWRSIIEHVDNPGYESGWTSTADLSRDLLARHPWSLTGGGAVELRQLIELAPRHLSELAESIGITAVTGADEFYLLPSERSAERLGWPSRILVEGDRVRDWSINAPHYAAWPYDSSMNVATLESLGSFGRWLKLFKPAIDKRRRFGVPMVERGLAWYEWQELYTSKFRTRLSITFAFVATHNHFVLERDGNVFTRTAPVIKLHEGASEATHIALLGILNSSTACFWLKENSHNKGSTVDAAGARTTLVSWENFYEFTGTTLQDFPLPSRLPSHRARMLDSLARKVQESNPEAIMRAGVQTRAQLQAALTETDRLRGRMIAEQEELDWEVYGLYGIIDRVLTYDGDDLPQLALGQRAFEIALARGIVAGKDGTDWFDRHGSIPITDLPPHWPAPYRDLVERRLKLIALDKSIRLLETPEHKRRWAIETWDRLEARALRAWLLDRLEDSRLWFDAQGRPTPRSIAQLADDVARDPAQVSVLAMWEGRPDISITTTLIKLVSDESVPFLAAYRYKGSGLQKRLDWEETWALQRREYAGEDLDPIPVPPKYALADFVKTSYWQARGKLDIPKERFILYPGAGRNTDPTPVLGWAGWDHAQQALALNALIQLREQEGWDDERLIPLIAGLAELQPWIDQWHAAVDPTYGVSLAVFCREQLTIRSQRAGKTIPEIAAWRPEPSITRRGRKPRAKGASS